MSHQTEIKIPNGKMKCMAASEIMKKTKCFKCQQDIYIVHTTMGVKLPVSKRGDEYVTHDMECPHSQLKKAERREEKARQARMQMYVQKSIKKKKYDKRTKKVRSKKER